MNIKKITAIAAAVVMAAGIVTGVPMSTETTSPLAITAEAASSDFVIKTDKDGDTYVAEYKGKGGDIVIPDGVVAVGEKVFAGNDKITSVTFPKSFWSIDKNAFEECKNLKTVVFEGDIQFDDSAFRSCINLESVTIKGSLLCIASNAFRDCNNLKVVKIFKDDKKCFIGYGAFRDCHSLTSINIPSKCYEIYARAFLNCFNLTKLTIPANTEIVTKEGAEPQFGYVQLFKTESDCSGFVLNGANEDKIECFVADGKKSGYFFYYTTGEELNKSEKNLWSRTDDYDGNIFYVIPKKITPKQLTLTVTKGSPAEKWAKENGVKYVYAGSSSTTTATPNSTTQGKLAAPTGIKGTVSEDKIVLKWNNISGAKAYRVYKYDSKTGKYVKYKDVSGTQCTVTGLKSGTKYSFKVYALTSENGKFVPQTSSKAVAFTTKEYNTDYITM